MYDSKFNKIGFSTQLFYYLWDCITRLHVKNNFGTLFGVSKTSARDQDQLQQIGEH